MTANKQLPMGKHVQHNADTGQYDFYYNRHLLGSRANERDAKNALAEYVYDLERGYIQPQAVLAQADTLIRAVFTPPEVERHTWQSEDGVFFTDFHAGAGLTRVMIGTYGSDKPGLELVVGGYGINEMIDEVLTLADIRQLRDNLDALLNDARLLAVEVA